KKEYDADGAVHREERGVELGEVVWRNERMLIGQQAGRHRDAKRVERAGMRSVERRRADGRETAYGEQMKTPCDHQRSGLSKRNGKREQPLALVEVDVLKRIKDVEAATPRGDRQRKRDEHPCRFAPGAGHCEIAANRSDRHSDAEHEVAPAREALRE